MRWMHIHSKRNKHKFRAMIHRLLKKDKTRCSALLVSLVLIISVNFNASAQREYPPIIEGATEITYKEIDSVKLNLWVFNPIKHNPSDKKPAIVFFFGGAWKSGTPAQFVKHAEYFATRGMVSIVVDYRVKSRNNVQSYKCVSDSKSAIRWVRENAEELGVDPNRIVASGGSAGGHLAAATAILPDFDEPFENTSISSKPNALVLFNPVLMTKSVKGLTDGYEHKFKNFTEKRLGTSAESMSPYHHISSDTPPTIIFHGTEDTTVPFESIQLFTEKMKEVGNNCMLFGYEGEPHGFFNYGRKLNGAFIDSVNKLDQFLVSLGYLTAPPKSILRK